MRFFIELGLLGLDNQGSCEVHEENKKNQMIQNGREK